jgi:hypothetical protein
MPPGTVTGLPALQNLVWGRGVTSDICDADPIIARIYQILTDRRQGRDTGNSDLAALLRHALMARGSFERPAPLSVPKSLAWGTPDQWLRFGLRATDLGDSLLLEPAPWRPQWLGATDEDGDDIFGDVFRRKLIRLPATTSIDPCVAEVSGFTSYVCPGQREAVRSLLFMPAGSTLVVNLPTGSGKTLVGEIPPLLHGLGSGLTLFIVPTKALALDQERRMREMLSRAGRASESHEFAWHADLSADTKAAIKRRIRSGSQGILFTSPESAVGALLPALYAAVSNGTLRYLVIDEAHIVAEWGDGFRPDFQRLAGLRTGLLRHCRAEKFRTVLMSATLSPDTLAILETLFGPPRQVQMVAAVHLRPEPRYWSYRATGWFDKLERILELLRHVPRPFILYLTEPKQAVDWLRLLRDEGFRRVVCFHGSTGGPERAAIIDAWTANRLDGIVATSAFGVGMDKADIPTIIHAVVPETLDRYYQEVGRGGRDGRASISVVVYTDRDVIKGRSLGRPRLLSGDNARQRWRVMFAHRDALPNTDLINIDIGVVPEHLRRQSDHNKAWNVRTLIMMARSRLIELETVLPQIPDRTPGEDEVAYEARIDTLWERYFDTITLRTLNPGHLRADVFEEKTAIDRTRAAQAAERTFGSLMGVLEGGREMGHELVKLYQSHIPDRTVIVSPACRGCPHGHESAGPQVDYQIPSGGGIVRTIPFDVSTWSRRFSRHEGTMTVHYSRDDPNLPARLRVALTSLVGVFGLPEIVAPRETWHREPWMARLHKAALGGIVIARDLEEELAHASVIPLPRATLLWPWPTTALPDRILLLERKLHVIFVPDDLKAHHPLRRHVDTADYALSLDKFLEMATR